MKAGATAVTTNGGPHAGLRLALGVLLAVAAYYAGAYLSIALRAPPAGISIIWPPNAILLAALLLSPPRTWWLYLAAALPAHLHVVANYQPGVPLLINFVQFGGNCAQALIAAVMLRRLALAPPRFDEVRPALWFVLVAAVAAPTLASSVTVYVFTIAQWAPDYWVALWRRILTNTIPALTLTPLLVIAANGGWRALPRVPLKQWAEFGLLAVILIAAGVGVFGSASGSSLVLTSFLFLFLPMLLWAAVRFGVAALSWCTLTLTGLSLAYSYYERGPFETLARAENVLALQIYLIAIHVPVMLLAATIKDRQRTANALRRSQERHSLAAAAGSVGAWEWDLTTGAIEIDPVINEMLGYSPAEMQETLNGWAARVHPDDLAESRALAQAHIDGKTPAFESEHRVLHKDGSIRWFLARGMVSERVSGRAIHMVGTTTDITERKRSEEALRRSREHIRELAGRLISAQEVERRRIARDLHDDLNQKVAALAITISNIRHHLPAAAQSLSEDLFDLQSRTSQLAHDIRELSHEIHPATLEHAGLVPALTSYAAELKQLEGIDLQLQLPDAFDAIPQDVAICIYRVAQESIRNVLRHSGMRSAQVTLHRAQDQVTLVVRDEGRGFDASRPRDQKGLGLISIEERVRLLNGIVEVESQQGRGTTLQVCIPLP
jgi:PAS domain S-box-containing protein